MYTVCSIYTSDSVLHKQLNFEFFVGQLQSCEQFVIGKSGMQFLSLISTGFINIMVYAHLKFNFQNIHDASAYQHAVTIE